jgi:CRP/FNR family transcriptional regulator, nitrogen oxide reductase regulator
MTSDRPREGETPPVMTAHLDRSLVSDLPLFAAMVPEELDDILAEARTRLYARNEVVFTQGEDAHSFFVLLHGRLRVTQITATGEQIVVRFVGPGDIFGVAMALQRTTYPGTATAIVDSVALTWPSTSWWGLIARHPALAANALTTIGGRLQDAHARLREIQTEDVERRVAHALLRLADEAGAKTAEGTLIDFPFTRQDIAEMTGTTLHTVSRIMSAWEASGLVEGGRQRVLVRDLVRLAALAEGTDESPA